METTLPKFLTIKELAATGILPEHAIRKMVKAGQLPVIFSGKKALINYTALIDYFNSLSVNI